MTLTTQQVAALSAVAAADKQLQAAFATVAPPPPPPPGLVIVLDNYPLADGPLAAVPFPGPKSLTNPIGATDLAGTGRDGVAVVDVDGLPSMEWQDGQGTDVQFPPGATQIGVLLRLRCPTTTSWNTTGDKLIRFRQGESLIDGSLIVSGQKITFVPDDQPVGQVIAYYGPHVDDPTLPTFLNDNKLHDIGFLCDLVAGHFIVTFDDVPVEFSGKPFIQVPNYVSHGAASTIELAQTVNAPRGPIRARYVSVAMGGMPPAFTVPR